MKHIVSSYDYEKKSHDFLAINDIHLMSYPTQHNIHAFPRQFCQIIKQQRCKPRPYQKKIMTE